MNADEPLSHAPSSTFDTSPMPSGADVGTQGTLRAMYGRRPRPPDTEVHHQHPDPSTNSETPEIKETHLLQHGLRFWGHDTDFEVRFRFFLIMKFVSAKYLQTDQYMMCLHDFSFQVLETLSHNLNTALKNPPLLFLLRCSVETHKHAGRFGREALFSNYVPLPSQIAERIKNGLIVQERDGKPHFGTLKWNPQMESSEKISVFDHLRKLICFLIPSYVWNTGRIPHPKILFLPNLTAEDIARCYHKTSNAKKDEESRLKLIEACNFEQTLNDQNTPAIAESVHRALQTAQRCLGDVEKTAERDYKHLLCAIKRGGFFRKNEIARLLDDVFEHYFQEPLEECSSAWFDLASGLQYDYKPRHGPPSGSERNFLTDNISNEQLVNLLRAALLDMPEATRPVDIDVLNPTEDDFSIALRDACMATFDDCTKLHQLENYSPIWYQHQEFLAHVVRRKDESEQDTVESGYQLVRLIVEQHFTECVSRIKVALDRCSQALLVVKNACKEIQSTELAVYTLDGAPGTILCSSDFTYSVGAGRRTLTDIGPRLDGVYSCEDNDNNRLLKFRSFKESTQSEGEVPWDEMIAKLQKCHPRFLVKGFVKLSNEVERELLLTFDVKSSKPEIEYEGGTGVTYANVMDKKGTPFRRMLITEQKFGDPQQLTAVEIGHILQKDDVINRSQSDPQKHKDVIAKLRTSEVYYLPTNMVRKHGSNLYKSLCDLWKKELTFDSGCYDPHNTSINHFVYKMVSLDDTETNIFVIDEREVAGVESFLFEQLGFTSEYVSIDQGSYIVKYNYLKECANQSVLTFVFLTIDGHLEKDDIVKLCDMLQLHDKDTGALRVIIPESAATEQILLPLRDRCHRSALSKQRNGVAFLCYTQETRVGACMLEWQNPEQVSTLLQEIVSREDIERYKRLLHKIVESQRLTNAIDLCKHVLSQGGTKLIYFQLDATFEDAASVLMVRDLENGAVVIDKISKNDEPFSVSDVEPHLQRGQSVIVLIRSVKFHMLEINIDGEIIEAQIVKATRDPEKKVSFGMFLESIPIAEWLDQQHREILYHLLVGGAVPEFDEAFTNYHVSDIGKQLAQPHPSMTPKYPLTRVTKIMSREDNLFQSLENQTEIDWEGNEMAWGEGFQYSQGFLLSVAQQYFQPLRFMCSVGAANVAFALEGLQCKTKPSAVNRLMSRISDPCVVKFLRMMGDKYPGLDNFLSCLKWNFVLGGYKQSNECFDFPLSIDARDFDNIVKSGIVVDLAMLGDSETRANVISTLIQLDSLDSSALINQVRIRDCFWAPHGQHDGLKPSDLQRLKDRSITMGLPFVAIVVRAPNDRTLPLTENLCFRAIKMWYDSNQQNATQFEDAVGQMSTNAAAFLLVYGGITRKRVEELIRALGDKAPDVIRHAAKVFQSSHVSTMKRALTVAMCCSKEAAKCKDIIPEVHKALCNGMDSFVLGQDTYEFEVDAEINELLGLLAGAFDNYPNATIQERLVFFSKNLAVHSRAPTLAQAATILRDQRNTVGQVDSLNLTRTVGALWYLQPLQPCGLTTTNDDDRQVVRELFEHTKNTQDKFSAEFIRVVKKDVASASTIALALTGQVEYIPLGFYNELCVLCGYAPIELQRVLITTQQWKEDDTHPEYPVYHLTYHHRPLPPHQRAELLEKKYSLQPKNLPDAPRVSSGVDRHLIAHNLNFLKYCHQHIPKKPDDKPNKNTADYGIFYPQIVKLWFSCMGCQDASSLCEKAEDAKIVKSVLANAATKVDKRSLVFHPMPACIDLTVRQKSQVLQVLNTSSVDNIVHTLQILGLSAQTFPRATDDMKGFENGVIPNPHSLLDGEHSVMTQLVLAYGHQAGMRALDFWCRSSSGGSNRTLKASSLLLSPIVLWELEQLDPALRMFKEILRPVFDSEAPDNVKAMFFDDILLAVGFLGKWSQSFIREMLCPGVKMSKYSNAEIKFFVREGILSNITCPEGSVIEEYIRPAVEPTVLQSVISKVAEPTNGYMLHARSSTYTVSSDGSNTVSMKNVFSPVRRFKNDGGDGKSEDPDLLNENRLSRRKIVGSERVIDISHIFEVSANYGFYSEVRVQKGFHCYLQQLADRLVIVHVPQPDRRTLSKMANNGKAWSWCTGGTGSRALIFRGGFMSRRSKSSEWNLYFARHNPDNIAYVWNYLALSELLCLVVNPEVIQYCLHACKMIYRGCKKSEPPDGDDTEVIQYLSTHPEEAVKYRVVIDFCINLLRKQSERPPRALNAVGNYVSEDVSSALLHACGPEEKAAILDCMTHEDCEWLEKSARGIRGVHSEMAQSLLKERKVSGDEDGEDIAKVTILDIVFSSRGPEVDGITGTVSTWLKDWHRSQNERRAFFSRENLQFNDDIVDPPPEMTPVEEREPFGFGYKREPPSRIQFAVTKNLARKGVLRYYALPKKDKFDPCCGMTLGYIVDDRLMKEEHYFSEELDRSELTWLMDVLRSPLDQEMKKWFLQYYMTPACWSPSPIDNSHIGTQVICFAIADRCPTVRHATKRKYLLAGVRQPHVMANRKISNFGVFAVDSRNEFCTRDCVQIVKAANLADETLYYNIRRAFGKYTTHVLVEGKKEISDLLLKWLCEHTAQVPWHYIILLKCDTTFNLPETRDRVQTMMLPEDIGRTTVQTSFAEGSQGRIEDCDKAAKILHGKETNLVGDWERQVDDYIMNVAKYPQMVLLVVSPPGAGKTEQSREIQQKVNEHGGNYYWFDCSDEALVENSLKDLVDQCVGDERAGTFNLLVADEYHFLNAAKKRELLLCIAGRMSWLRVMLIANRRSDQDHDILKMLKSRVTNPDYVQAIDARLSKEKIRLVLNKRNNTCQEDHRQYIVAFYAANRALFSDDSNSLRFLQCFEFLWDSTKTKDTLISTLQDKLVTLGETSPREFVNYFHRLWNECRYIGLVNESYLRSLSSPISFLVHTAMLLPLLKPHRCDLAMSFREFVTEVGMPINRVHPAFRLRAWCMYICDFVDLERKPPPEQVLNTLLRLKLVDQQGFPLVDGELTKQCDSNNVLAKYRQGRDYGDLDWIEKSLIQGHQMNWPAVGQAWARRPVTNGQKLKCVCEKASPSLVLEKVAPANLLQLARKSDDLHETIVHYYNTQRLWEKERKTYVSPYFYVLWNQFCNQPIDTWKARPLEFVHKLLHRLVQDIPALHLDVVTLEFLRWGSDYGSLLSDVHDDKLEMRSECVGRSACLALRTLMVSKPEEALAYASGLYSMMFAPLAIVNGTEGLPIVIAWHLALTNPALPSWPDGLKLIVRARHGRLSPKDVDDLVNTYKVLDDPDVPPHLFGKMMCAEPPGEFDVDTIQSKMLAYKIQVSRNDVPPHCDAVYLRNFESGVSRMKKISEIHLQGDVGENVKNMFHRMRKVGGDVSFEENPTLRD